MSKALKDLFMLFLNFAMSFFWVQYAVIYPLWEHKR